MNAWEYVTITNYDLKLTARFIMTEDTTAVNDEFNKLGEQGWEMVSLCLREGGAFVAVFKRQRPKL